MKHEVTSVGITLGELPEARQRIKMYLEALLKYRTETNTQQSLIEGEIQRTKQWLLTTKNK